MDVLITIRVHLFHAHKITMLNQLTVLEYNVLAKYIQIILQVIFCHLSFVFLNTMPHCEQTYIVI